MLGTVTKKNLNFRDLLNNSDEIENNSGFNVDRNALKVTRAKCYGLGYS